MWVYKPNDPTVIMEFFRMTHVDLWRILVKPQQAWIVEERDRGLDDKNPPVEEWLVLAKNIDEPAPLLKEPRSELLAAMLVPKLYKALEPKKSSFQGSSGH
ncbi:wall-associated receptor kinase 3 [Hordeum vulgare]|nr:wall-associated receptor kinase 3 [Hordeum vulgare]